MAVLKDLIVHGNSRFLNGAKFNTINAESIGAEQGIFNKLIATTLDAKEATIDNLTAQNATVVGLLDVQGELHTNAWTNANIANIGGSFYISPTVEPTDGTTTISITRNSATSWTVSASGTFATDFIKSGTATSGVAWPANSLVLITGDVVIGDMVYPLGTLKGTLSAQVTATAASTSKTITITGVTDAQNNNAPSVLQELYEVNNNANISNAAFKKGKISLYKLGSNPIGILLSSMGTSSNSLIDIYGGVSTNPNVRIGHLAGLPNVNGSAPTGWGIYTDNGYFSGVIVSTSGKIGGYTLDDTSLYSGTKGNSTTSGHFTLTTGTFTRAIDGTSRSNLQMALGAKFGVANDGTLYANGANITSINAGNITAGDIAAARIQTNLITAINAKVSDLSALSATIGGFKVDSTSIHTNNVAVTSNADNSIALSSADFTRTINSTSRAGLRFAIGDKFGVTGDGIIYASNANISGEIAATSGSIASSVTIGGTTASTVVSNAADGATAKEGLDNLQIGGRNLFRYTSLTDVISSKWIKNGTAACSVSGEKLTITGAGEVYPTSTYYTPYVIPIGTTITLSCYFYENTVSDGNRYIYYAVTPGWRNKRVPANYVGLWSETFTTTEELTVLCPEYDLRSSTGGQWVVSPLKLEIGNKATAWSPAPEDLDVHKYVTDIDTNKGITIKPLISTGNDYLQIDSTSIDFYRGIGTNSAAVSVMSLSDSVFRMGKSNAQRVEITASAVDMYDKNNKLTTRVNENGLTIYKAGTQVASYGTDATIGQVAANLYNVFIDADSGIALRQNTTSLLTINSNQIDINNSSGNVMTRVDSSGLIIYDGSGTTDANKLAVFGSTATIGVTSGNKYNIYIDGNAVNLRYNTNVLNEITADGMKLYLSDDNINSIAEFGETTRIGKEIGAYISVGGDNIRGNSADGEYFSISGTGGIITSKATLAQFAINVNISNYTTGLATYTSWSNIATGDIVYVKIEYTYTYKYNNNTYTTTKIISSNFVKGTSRTTDYFTYTSPATFASAKGGPLPSVPSAATDLKMTKKFVILTYMHERSAPLYRFGDDVAAEGGAYSFLTGLGTVSTEPYQLVCGKYNANVGSGITAFDAPFVIGNGTGSDPSERSNAFAVDLLGRVYMGNVIYMYPLADKDKSNTRIMCYNYPSTGTADNYGCLGFQAESTVSGKPAYFAFWTQSPGTNSGSQTGRFYITETSVYTANSTPFTSAGKLTVSNSTNNDGATIYGATTITGNVSITSSTTTSLISNGRIYANTNAAASYGMFLGRGYSDGAFTTNRGLYDLKKGDWALHINSDGQTYLDIAGKESEVSYTANVYMSTAGHIVRRSGSSKRFKHNIIAIKDTELDPHKLYDLKVVQFNYNADYINQSDWRAKLNIPGFIAEDVAEIYPIAAEHDEEGIICDWGERYIIPPMLKLIQEQKKEIEQLKKEVQELKNK